FVLESNIQVKTIGSGSRRTKGIKTRGRYPGSDYYVRINVFGFIENKKQVSSYKVDGNRTYWQPLKNIRRNGVSDDSFPHPYIGSGYRESLSDRSISPSHGDPE